MKRNLSTLTLAAAILPFAPSAFAAEDGGAQISNYVSFGVGMGLIDDADLSGLAAGTVELSHSTDLHGAFGWAFDTTSAFDYRAEVELGYQRAELDSANGLGGPSSSLGGSVTSLSLSVNGYVDWHFADQWSAYAGLGLGVNHTEATLTIGPTTGLSGTEIGYQWQGILGAGYQLTPRTTLFAEYRYVQSLTDTDMSNGLLSLDGLTGHHIGVGVRVAL